MGRLIPRERASELSQHSVVTEMPAPAPIEEIPEAAELTPKKRPRSIPPEGHRGRRCDRG